MPPREWRSRIQDILDSIAVIQEYVRGMDLEAFRSNGQVLDAVEHRFAVIGEATANVPGEMIDAHPEIPWRQMRGMRNVMVHAYFGVKTDVLWGTVQNDLPPLVPHLRGLLEEDDHASRSQRLTRMDVVQTIEDVRKAVAAARAAGRVVGLVPTMGNLHEGHMSLLDAARASCGFVAVSIFVNPTQFGPAEDFASYPRTPEEDLALCRAHGADLVFRPEVLAMYPAGGLTEVHVPRLSQVLCGASRPIHFTGVATVVAKLLNIFQPDRAFFGAKDFQQTVVIRRMVKDLDFPVEIVVCPTVRAKDGLALSSRNAYLSAEHRRQAPALHGSLRLAAERIRRGSVASEDVAAAVRAFLAERAPEGIVDYVGIVDPATLADVETASPPVLVALAVKFGRARLIDNILVDATS